MKQITIKASQIVAALEAAKTKNQQWQAGLLQMLVDIPALAERWNELNERTDLRIQEEPGVPYLNYTREMNRAMEDWTVICGWTFHMGVIQYNSVREDGYMHSAGVTWDGIQRRTRCGFLEMLRMLTLDALGMMEINHRVKDAVLEAGIEFVDDLDVPLWSVYVNTKVVPDVWHLHKRKVAEDRVISEAIRLKGQPWNDRVALIRVNREEPPPETLTELPELTRLV